MNINDNNCAKVSHDISNWDFGENTSASDKANDSIVPTIQGSIQQPLSSNVIPKPATSTSLSKNLQDTTDSTTNKFSKFVDAVLRNTSGEPATAQIKNVISISDGILLGAAIQ